MAYSWKHDADFDPDTDSWDHPVCDSEDCFMCKDRPEKPSQVPGLPKWGDVFSD